jgi:ubiquinone/menaquinone biosynthesis C-methylase UbiE
MDERETTKEVSIQEGYTYWAASYDLENNALIAVEEIYVDPLLAQLSFKHVLDVGTGTGRYALKLAREGATVTALDPSPEMMAVAQQRAQDEGLSIDFQLTSLDAGLPLADNQFDLLICALVLCHVSDMAATIKEFIRVLQPNGYMLITDFHPGSVQVGWRTQFKQEGVKYLLPNVPHTRDDYLQALTSNGLRILHVLDLPLRKVPEGYLSNELLYGHEEQLFSLVILAQK